MSQLEKDEIEDVTDEMLDRLIKDGKTLAVLFCKSNVVLIDKNNFLTTIFCARLVLFCTSKLYYTLRNKGKNR